MTHEEIDAAQERIATELGWFGTNPRVQNTLDLLNALCEAAKAEQTESFVGKMVRTTMGYTGTVKAHGWMIDVGRGEKLFHQDGQFELIEPTGEKGGDEE